MHLSRYDPLMPNTEEKFGSQYHKLVQWRKVGSTAYVASWRWVNISSSMWYGRNSINFSLIQRKIYGNEYCITRILWYRKYFAHPNHIEKSIERLSLNGFFYIIWVLKKNFYIITMNCNLFCPIYSMILVRGKVILPWPFQKPHLKLCMNSSSHLMIFRPSLFFYEFGNSGSTLHNNTPSNGSGMWMWETPDYKL